MELLQPGWLVGALGIALPILIHFWFQKNAQVLPWAASRWLTGNAVLQHRGLRLHDILLLIIRCLIVILLSIILAQPMFDMLKNNRSKEIIHLVEPNAALVSGFRFELENAIKKGEKVIWISSDPTLTESLTDLPDGKNNHLHLQQTIITNTSPQDSLRIYITNNQDVAALPKVILKSPYLLFIFDQKQPENIPDLAGILTDRQVNPTVLLRYRNKLESETVRAALAAFQEVYRVSFDIDSLPNANRKYDFIFSNAIPEKIDTETGYVISGKVSQTGLPENVRFVSDSLYYATSDLVKTGRLPEWLGEMFVSHDQLDSREMQISHQQIRSRFERGRVSPTEEVNAFKRWLLLSFLLLLICERWLALRKKAMAHV